jgi:ribosomal protein S18 acetylase RimI-like enzyme
MNEDKPHVLVRAATEDDIAALMGLDHGYSTEYVWQMELDPGKPRMGASFREARLPRAMQVTYPRPKGDLESNWSTHAATLVAENNQQPVGYASLIAGLAPGAAWVSDLVVGASQRRKGVGTRLVLAAQAWAREHGYERLVLEMQSKNYPAIKLAQKLAFEFSGYNDRYYENQDIALFFAKRLT